MLCMDLKVVFFEASGFFKDNLYSGSLMQILLRAFENRCAGRATDFLSVRIDYI